MVLLLAPLSRATGQRASLVVQGTVVDSTTGAALGGVSVELLGTSVRAVTQSDGAGRVQIGDLRPGGYTLVVRRIGYAMRAQEQLELARDTTLSLGLARLAREIASVVVRDSTTGIHGVVGTAAGLHPILAANWEDLDQRQRWRTVNSALISGLDLTGRGGTVSDALLMTPAFAQRGLRVNGATCVFVDGVPRPGMPLDAIAPEQIEMIEVYGISGEQSGSLIKRWPAGVECAGGSRSTTAPGISERGIVRFAVIWLKR